MEYHGVPAAAWFLSGLVIALSTWFPTFLAALKGVLLPVIEAIGEVVGIIPIIGDAVSIIIQVLVFIFDFFLSGFVTLSRRTIDIVMLVYPLRVFTVATGVMLMAYSINPALAAWGFLMIAMGVFVYYFSAIQLQLSQYL